MYLFINLELFYILGKVIKAPHLLKDELNNLAATQTWIILVGKNYEVRIINLTVSSYSSQQYGFGKKQLAGMETETKTSKFSARE